MNTLHIEDVLLEQPSAQEQAELMAIFKDLNVEVQGKIDIVMNKSGSCGGNGGG